MMEKKFNQCVWTGKANKLKVKPENKQNKISYNVLKIMKYTFTDKPTKFVSQNLKWNGY